MALGDLNDETNPLDFDISPEQLEVELNLLWNVNSVTGAGGGDYIIEFSTAPNGLFGDGSGLTPDSEVVVTPLDAVSYCVQVKQKSLKIVILITDNVPGGFCDSDTPSIKANARKYAEMARCNDVRIAAVMVGPDLGGEAAVQVMVDYASISCGWYSQIGSDGAGIDDAILNMIYEDLPLCSTPMPDCETHSPLPPCGP